MERPCDSDIRLRTGSRFNHIRPDLPHFEGSSVEDVDVKCDGMSSGACGKTSYAWFRLAPSPLWCRGQRILDIYIYMDLPGILGGSRAKHMSRCRKLGWLRQLSSCLISWKPLVALDCSSKSPERAIGLFHDLSFQDSKMTNIMRSFTSAPLHRAPSPMHC